MTLTKSITSRLCVPMTPTELAALFGVPLRTIRATLYNLRRDGRVERLERGVPSTGRRGPKLELMWQKKYS